MSAKRNLSIGFLLAVAALSVLVSASDNTDDRMGDSPDEDPSILAELLRRRRQAPSPDDAGNSGNVFKFLSELGPQVEKAQGSAKTFTSLFSSGPQGAGDQSNPLAAANSAIQASQLMNTFNEMLKSAQDNTAKITATGQTNLQTAQQSSAAAAQEAQGGIQSALKEIGLGLQKIATNNPSLIPDVKNLYQSVSSKLSAASSSVSQAAIPGKSNADQISDSLSKSIANPSL